MTQISLTDAQYAQLVAELHDSSSHRDRSLLQMLLAAGPDNAISVTPALLDLFREIYIDCLFDEALTVAEAQVAAAEWLKLFRAGATCIVFGNATSSSEPIWYPT